MAARVTLQQLELFRAVARNRSFSDAARELYTSQPHVSNQVRKLEAQLGVPLFVRSRPRIGLTDAGEVLHRRINAILHDVDLLEEVGREFQELQRGVIEVAATESFGNHTLPQVIASFRRRHPGVVVHARIGNTEEVLGWVDLDDADLGIGPAPGDIAIDAEALCDEPLVVIAPTGLELPDPLPVIRFLDLPQVVRESGSATRAALHALAGEDLAGLEVVTQLGGTTAVNEAVAAGIGAALVPANTVGRWGGDVQVRTLSGTAPVHAYHLLTSPRRARSPAAAAFVDHLKAEVPAS